MPGWYRTVRTGEDGSMRTGSPPPGHASRSPLFIGRQNELDRLIELLREAANGKPATLIVRGEAGVGKSRLLAEFGRRARESGARVLTGSCIALGTGELAYAPLIDALRRLVREVGQERVRDLAGPGHADLASLISDFTDPAGVTRPAAPVLAAQSRVFGAVLRLLEHLGDGGPVVLVLEDLQWADPSTLDLLAYLSRAQSDERLLEVGTYRTNDLTPRHPLRVLVAELDLARRVQQIEIRRFDRGELKQFLRGATDLETTHDLVERAFELSDGNAFFVEELLAAGALAPVVRTGPVRPPGSVRDLVLSRYELLGQDAQDVMRVAATAGRRVSHRLLDTVCELPRRQLLAALRECVDSQMLVVDPGEDTYVFRHALLREVVHQELLPGERLQLHRSIALALAADSRLSYAEELTVAAELSYHWYEAREYPRALAAAVHAGDQAMRLLAFREAEQQYDRALAVWPRLDDAEQIAGLPKPRLLVRAADAARWAGRIDRAVELARDAVSTVDAARQPATAGEMYERLGSYLWDAGDRGGSERAYAQAAQLLAGAPPSAATARILVAQASTHVHQGRFAVGLKLGQDALELAQSVGAGAEEGRALDIVGLALTMQGETEAGVETLREAVRRADAGGQLEDLFRAYGNLAFALENAGRLEESVAVALEGLTRAGQTGLDHSRGGSVLANNACAALVQLGRWDDASDIIGNLLRDRSMAESLFPRLTLAEIAVGRGEFDAVDELLAAVREAGESVRQPQFVGSLYAYTAEAAIWRRRYEAARDAVADGLRALDGTEDRVALLKLCALGMRNAADQWLRLSSRPGTGGPDLAAVESIVDDLTANLSDHRGPASEPVLPDVTALLLQCQAERDRIGEGGREPRWSQTAQAWEALGRPYPTAYARWRQAEAAARAGWTEEARTAARDAYRLATRLKAGALVEELRALAIHARLSLEDEEAGQPAPAAPVDDPFHLTSRERQVLALVCEGCSNQQIAARLYVTKKTAEVHVSNILHKLEVTSRGQAAAKARDLGLLDGGGSG